MQNNGFIESITSVLTDNMQSDLPYMSEEELASRVNASRTRLRESLQIMDAYGLIEKKQRLGVKLKDFDYHRMKEIYDLRAMLESYAMEAVLEHISMRDIRKLEKLSLQITECEKANDRPGALKADLEFHYDLIAIAGLPLVDRILRQLRLIEYSFAVCRNKWNPGQVNPWSHELLIEKLKSHSPECAEVLRNHIKWGEELCNTPR